MKRSFPSWQIGGFVVTSITGTLLHFLYDWSGQSLLLAPFSAVNESIWEHMKLVFFPTFLFAVYEAKRFPQYTPNFWCVKLLGIGTALLLIPTIYYTYTGALGVYADWFNITIFFLAAAAAFRLETAILEKGTAKRACGKVCLALLLLIGLAFALLTFFPIRIPLFEDPVTGLYGIASGA